MTVFFLVNRAGENTLLRKQADGRWTVNNQFNAAPDKIERLLKTMNKLEAKNPVSQAAQQRIVNDLAVSGIKVQAFMKNGDTKTYYVGGQTADEMGTFMYMDGSTIPFVVHIPGFRGYLTPRYSVNPLDWRDKAIFATPVDKLAAVQVTYPDTAQKSFQLVKDAANNFTVKQNGAAAAATKQEFAKLYAAQFNNITFEAYLSGYSKSFVDSLQHAKPKAIVAITRNDGSTATLRIYYKPVTSDTKSLYDDKGNMLVYDSDNYFALIDGSPELITVQDYIFRHVLKSYRDFVKQ
ncbi:DUF4340 domain-containing protein [Oscillatoria amoena NRMC-F 0135]|nr:DUF4340 domain-containing protein [Oscillatoria amoena NRMC-F 0135]